MGRLNGVYSGDVARRGRELIEGRGGQRDRPAARSRSAGRRIRAERIVVAVGGKPCLPEMPGIEHAISSDDALGPAPAARAPGHRRRRLHRRSSSPGSSTGWASQSDADLRARAALRGFDATCAALAEEMREQGIDIRGRHARSRARARRRRLSLMPAAGDARGRCRALRHRPGAEPQHAGWASRRRRRDGRERRHHGRRAIAAGCRTSTRSAMRDHAAPARPAQHRPDAGRDRRGRRWPRPCSTTTRRRWTTDQCRPPSSACPRSAPSG